MFNIKRLIIILISHSILQISKAQVDMTKTCPMLNPWDKPPIMYSNRREKSFVLYDKVLALVLNVPNLMGDKEPRKVITLGIFITEFRILTSFNPFRRIIQSEYLASNLYACYTEKTNKHNAKYHFDYCCLKITRGRHIIPNTDKIMFPEELSGKDTEMSTIHDLMILRVNQTVGEMQRRPYETFPTLHPAVKIVRPAKAINKYYEIISLGLRNPDFTTLEKAKVYKLLNCDDWIPRNWGHFICVRNKAHYTGFSSGAILFTYETFLAIGSFTLFRGKESILVFTDVMPYEHHLVGTCVVGDLYMCDIEYNNITRHAG